MDYEKKYKEALSWMQSLYKGLHGATKEDAEHYFPELKESEDEKAIRDIKVVLESSATKFFKEEGKMPVWYDRAIAWLEKQGEQKPADNVEPKFKVGDFIVNDYCMGRVVEKTLITGETRNEAINRYRAMMKANEGKSFEERRDAINNFRSGKL